MCTNSPAELSIDPLPASAGRNATSIPISTSCSTRMPNSTSTYSNRNAVLVETSSFASAKKGRIELVHTGNLKGNRTDFYIIYNLKELR